MAIGAPAWPPTARATEAPTYAVLSLLGGMLTLVTFQPSTGSALDRNLKEDIAVAGMDPAAASAIISAIAHSQPEALVIPFPSVDDKLLTLGQPKAAIEALRSELKNMHATHVIVATKYRQAELLRWPRGHVGEGRLAGLGFYQDRTERQPPQGDPLDQGYSAAYAYARLWWAELSSMQTRDLPVLQSRVWPVMEVAGGADPWSVLTPAARLEDLRALIRQAMEDGVAKLLGEVNTRTTPIPVG